jgi:hypothetical protein
MRNLFRLTIAVVASWAVLQSPNILAQEISKSYFSKGVEYSRNGDCEKALKEFKLASHGGMNEPKLHYNMGVCEYKLNHYPEAKRAFGKAGESKEFFWLAEYNIGLVEKAGKNAQLANTYFQNVYDHSPDSKLHNLAGYQLGLQGTGDNYNIHAWSSLFYTSFGHDDNIVDPLQQANNRGDSFFDAFIYATKLLGGTPKDGVNIRLGAFTTRYQQVSVYNINQLQAGMGKTFTTGAWNNELAFDALQSTLGNIDYLRTNKLTVSTERKLNETDTVNFRYSFSNIQSLTPQNAFLDGINQKAKVTWKTQKKDNEYRLSYALEGNNRRNLNTGTTFSSYSPTRHSLEAKATMPIANQLLLEGSLNYRLSSYSNPNILAAGQTINRSDSRAMADIKIKKEMSKILEVYGEYNYTSNNSNISIYSYNRNIISIGLNAQF